MYRAAISLPRMLVGLFIMTPLHSTNQQIRRICRSNIIGVRGNSVATDLADLPPPCRPCANVKNKVAHTIPNAFIVRGVKRHQLGASRKQWQLMMSAVASAVFTPHWRRTLS